MSKIETIIETLATDEEKGIKIEITRFPKVPFIVFLTYDDGEITFSKQLVDLAFRFNFDYNNPEPQEIVDAMLKLAKQFKKAYRQGVEDDNPYRASIFCDKRDKTRQLFYMCKNQHFTNETLYEFALDCYSSIEDSYGFDIIFEILEMLYSLIDIKDKLIKDLGDRVQDGYVTVYRGINSKNREDGLSYTFSKDIARFFANRWGDVGHVNKYKVHVDDIIGFIDNKEEEIITKKAKLISKNI